MKGILRISSLFLLIFLIPSCKKEDKKNIIDGDGNIYSSINIGTQIWLIQDLKTTKYNDGNSIIPLVTDSIAWTGLATPGYCWYNNNDATYKNTYGALYNWYAVITNKLCPIGWHVPTDTEWTTLTDYLDGISTAGGKLKETGTTHWITPNTGATNVTGFTAIPGGERTWNTGGFAEIGLNSYYWSSTEDEFVSINGWGQGLSNTSSSIVKGGYRKTAGASVRCLKN